jgi:hypothetical protein
MNGAELPCGSVLHVEPADTNYYHGGVGEKKESPGNEVSASTNSKEAIPNGKDSLQKITAEAETKEPETTVSNDINDELDDFFHSLE